MFSFIKKAFICVVIINFVACESAKQEQVSGLAQPENISSESTSNGTFNKAAPGGSAGGGGREELQTEKISLVQADQSQNTQNVVERKIIRNANLTLETNSPEDAARQITATAGAKNGFVVTSDTQQHQSKSGSQNITVNMVLRVPSNQFESSLNEIRQTAQRVVQEKISGQDVTEEFIDLEARINAKKALESQFLEIMKQAKTVEDALKVQTELSEVRSEIERVQGRRKFLENQASYSTINITLNTPTVFASNSTGFISELWLAVSDGVDAALSVILFFIRAVLALLPLIILFGIPLYLLIRYFLKKNKRQKLAKELAQDERS
jgi:hypothetical protein